MRKNPWPEGLTMVVDCPNCAVLVDVQIAVVRDDDLPFRPADCNACGAEFDLLADGTAELTFAPPKRSTAKGLELLKTTFVFDPNAPE